MNNNHFMSMNMYIKKIPPPPPTPPNESGGGAKEDKKPTMEWGEPTWFFFHTLAEKIKEEKFNEIRVEFLNILSTICVNLPCPDCATHAKQYLQEHKFNNIRTKEDLKMFFFVFHNYVNNRKKYPIFLLEDLDAKYSKAITKNILYYFMNAFEKKNKNMRLIADDIHRQHIAKVMKKWLNNNISCFNE